MIIRTLVSGLFLWLASVGIVQSQTNPALGGMISDGDFTSWTPFHLITDDPFQAVPQPNTSTGRVDRLERGGNPGVQLRFSHSFAWGETSWIGAMKSDYSYDPHMGGEIQSLSLSADVNFLGIGGISWQLVVDQSGQRFFTVPWEQIADGLQTIKLKNLTPADFDTNPWADYSSSGVLRDGNRPDFSSNAPPLKFGFVFGNRVPGNSARTLTAAVTLDNYRVTITPVPPPVVEPPPVPVVVAKVEPVIHTPPPEPAKPSWSERLAQFINWRIVLWAAGGILSIISLLVIKPFNGLITLRNAVKKSWADIDVMLKRRHDLILNLAESVKGYAKHEQGTLEGVTKARTAAANASSVGERAHAEQSLNASVRTLFALVESYPDLKANQNFQTLTANLTDTESKIEKTRVAYNGEVLKYNNTKQQFPTNIIARLFRFADAEFFEFKDEAKREAPKVSF